jgi:hypothetical protein
VGGSPKTRVIGGNLEPKLNSINLYIDSILASDVVSANIGRTCIPLAVIDNG